MIQQGSVNPSLAKHIISKGPGSWWRCRCLKEICFDLSLKDGLATRRNSEPARMPILGRGDSRFQYSVVTTARNCHVAKSPQVLVWPVIQEWSLKHRRTHTYLGNFWDSIIETIGNHLEVFQQTSYTIATEFLKSLWHGTIKIMLEGVRLEEEIQVGRICNNASKKNAHVCFLSKRRKTFLLCNLLFCPFQRIKKAFVHKVAIFAFILKYKILSVCFKPTTVPELPIDFNSNLSCSGSVERRFFFFISKLLGPMISSPEAKVEPPVCLTGDYVHM